MLWPPACFGLLRRQSRAVGKGGRLLIVKFGKGRRGEGKGGEGYRKGGVGLSPPSFKILAPPLALV